MFCPQCGQQASDEIRFCPKCGLPLTPHAALLAGGNTTNVAAPGAAQPPVRTKKQIVTRRAAKLMFFSVALSPIFIPMCIAIESGEPLLLPFFIFMVGLMWLIYVRLFVDDVVPAGGRRSRKDLKAGGDGPALGAPTFVPASSFNQQRANTAEIVPPPSVTENTTTLLEKDV